MPRRSAIFPPTTQPSALISPLNILERGFALVYDEDKLTKRITQANKGGIVKIQLSDGYVLAEIKEIKSGKGD